ncbi:hypothetical protein REPUB_Repub18cG0068600 [Reevesia pubescens]
MSYPYKGRVLDFMSGIDLFRNQLTSQIPLELGNLGEIRSLNLPHNNLTGLIPSTFSKLKQIESLDLSSLSGRIPSQLIEMNSLVVFSVAHNNLSGSTPDPKAQFGTFDESSYKGYTLICGPPLHKTCNESSTAPNVTRIGECGLINMDVFYISFSVSYVTFFVGTFHRLVLKSTLATGMVFLC